MRRPLLLLVAGLVALGLGERGIRVLVARELLPTRGARWIWASGTLDEPRGLAFFAVQDFELEQEPGEGRVSLLADEEYILWINGRRVGSGRWRPGASLDTYALAGQLAAGWNRIAVELRSSRGAGGLLLALWTEDEEDPRVRSGADWHIFREAPGVVEGSRPLRDAEPPVVWQVPPTGAWGLPRLAPPSTPYGRLISTPPLEPVRELHRLELALTPDLPARSAVGFDFGEPVSGYLILEGLGEGPRRRLLSRGPAAIPNAEARPVLLATGQHVWSDSEVRTFRYAWLESEPHAVRARVVQIDPALAARRAKRAREQPTGVFGLRPPESF